MTELIAIAAIGKNRQIGINGKLPWDIPQEYQHYQDTVRGCPLIMGRKNYEANFEGGLIGEAFVLTRNREYKASKGRVFFTVDEIIQALNRDKIEKAFVIGGEDVYRLFMPYVDRLMLSYVDYDGDADTFFPEFSQAEWILKTEDQRKNYLFCEFTRAIESPSK